MSSAVCSRGILPVGCPCVLRRSRGKAMEMSHSGLVRLPAKEVGVEAPREFESPHLRQRKSSGANQRAGASSSAQPLPQRGLCLGRPPFNRRTVDGSHPAVYPGSGPSIVLGVSGHD